MIKAIVYDLDGMIVHEPHYYSVKIAKKYGIPLEEFNFDERYSECKKGNLTLRAFLEPLYKKWTKYSTFDLSLDEYLQGWFDYAQLNKSIIDIAKGLKQKGIKNFILTNNAKERVTYLDKKFNLSSTFTIIGSYDLGVLKPDPKFYSVLQDRYHLKPEEVLIFDDKEEKMKMVKKMGYHASVYSNRVMFLETLRKYDIPD